VAHGLSQTDVARAGQLSVSVVSRIERGERPRVPLVYLYQLASVVGLELSVRAYPAGDALRDIAHRDLLERLRARLSPSLRWRTEVPLPNPGDLRAWDALIAGERFRVGVEAETRATDSQAIERRNALKKRDGGVDRLILLLADTRTNRRFVREASPTLAERFPVSGRDALRALAEARDPGGDALILL
jgi:transcriptional regulator with XRE-family HTH domain